MWIWYESHYVNLFYPILKLWLFLYPFKNNFYKYISNVRYILLSGISLQKKMVKEVTQHHYVWWIKWRENFFEEREGKEKQAGRKHQELSSGHFPKRSQEAMEGMKLVMEISNTEKHPKKRNLQESSRQSGRGAVRIHKLHVSANRQQPSALLPITPMHHTYI